jgi:hypothetical protein
MTPGRTVSDLAVVTAFCVLAIFLFPAMQGSYSAMHGPVTALQAARSAARLRTAIVQFARTLSQDCRISLLTIFSLTPAATAEFMPVGLAECDGTLRC